MHPPTPDRSGSSEGHQRGSDLLRGPAPLLQVGLQRAELKQPVGVRDIIHVLIQTDTCTCIIMNQLKSPPDNNAAPRRSPSAAPARASDRGYPGVAASATVGFDTVAAPSVDLHGVHGVAEDRQIASDAAFARRVSTRYRLSSFQYKDGV